MLHGCAFQQTVSIHIGTNCAFLLDDLFLYSNEVDLLQGLLRKIEKKLAWPLYFTFRCIDDALSLNNSMLGDYVDRIYPIELEIRNTTYTTWSTQYIVNFPIIYSTLLTVHVYGLYISQLMPFSEFEVQIRLSLTENKIATKAMVLNDQAKVIISKVLQLPSLLSLMLQNICVTYAMF